MADLRQDPLEPIQVVTNSLNNLEIGDKGVDNGCEYKSLHLKLEQVDISDSSKCPPVVLIAGDKNEIRPYRNKYEIKGKYLRPAKVGTWVIVVLFDERIVLDIEGGFNLFNEVHKFAIGYSNTARAKGVSIKDVDTIQYVPNCPSINNTVSTMSKEDLRSELDGLIAKLNDNLIDHAIIILPEVCPRFVHGYLQYAETKVWGGVKKRGRDLLTRTSRIQYETMKKLGTRARDRGLSLFQSLWLKYNTKLGGINVALKKTFETHGSKFLNDGTLIISIDLCSLSSTVNEESNLLWQTVARRLDIVAAVGMWNLTSHQMSFRSQTRVQATGTSVVDIGDLIRDVLKSYKERKYGQLPTNIIIFRSVVQEFNSIEVSQREIMSIKAASISETKHPDTCPLLTYLMVPKKKKITKASQMVADPHANRVIRTGSLVDSILSDGALESEQRSTQPENRHNEDEKPPLSSRKVVNVFDEGDFSEDSIRTMINCLCYLSPRTTSKTRPTPVDLADLANERSRYISVAWFEDQGIDCGDDIEQVTHKLNRFLTTDMGDENLRNTLYYV